MLALNQLDVRAAKMSVEDGYATGVFAVRPRFGRAPVPEILADGVRAALEGTLPLADRLRQREADYRQDGARSAPPRISWHNGEVSGADDRHRRGARRRPGRAALPAHRGDTAARASTSPRARIETLGADAVDCFYVCNPSGTPVDAEQRRRVDDGLVDGHRGRRRRPAGSGRHAGLSPAVLSVGRATVDGSPGRNGPACREEPDMDSRLWPCPPVRRDRATFVQPPCADGHTADGGDCPEWACADCGAALVIGDAAPARPICCAPRIAA